MKKVPEQKGPINPNPGTQKSTPQPIKAMRQIAENMMIHRNQQLDLHEPKK
jgi:hypothetical protein